MEAFVVAGGGVAGSIAATALSQAGHSPLLLERTHGAHHKVCGEFLSWEASDRLQEIGFDPSVLGGARITRVRLFVGSRWAEATLPRAATGISRFRLDEALLTHAGRAGTRIERGVTIGSVRGVAGGIAVDIGGDYLLARTLLLATGKSSLRGVIRNLEGQTPVTDLVGFKTHYRLLPRQTSTLGGAVELHLFEGGYAGLQLVEEGRANLCLLVRREKVADAQGDWGRILNEITDGAPVLGDRLDGGEMLFSAPLAVSGIPFGFVHRSAAVDLPGVVRLGDQFAVPHSFTGDGMALAMESGRMGGGLAHRGEVGQDQIHNRIRRGVSQSVRASSALHHLLHQPSAQTLFLPLAQIFPQLLTIAARLTRVKKSEL